MHAVVPRRPDYARTATEVAGFCRVIAPKTDRIGVLTADHFLAFRRSGLLRLPIDTGEGCTPLLLEVLTTIGGGDLSLGRLYEGHVNALLLVLRFGTPEQRRRVSDSVRLEGTLLGVWNTDAADRLSLDDGPAGPCLAGGKSFASGAGLVDLALVTATRGDGARQMLLVPMKGMESRLDRASWQPLGMRASMSFSVDFTGIAGAELLGGPGDYLAEPWFSAGCIRFSAAQLGGAVALARVVHDHLRATGRQTDPHQEQRFARMRVALEGGRLWLDHAAAAYDRPGPPSDAIVTARMARHAVEEACHLVLDLAARSVGVAGMLAPHPLERLTRDLTTYLRQPAPDAALSAVGSDALGKATMPW